MFSARGDNTKVRNIPPTTTMTNVRELAPELAKQAEAELNEVSSRTAEDLKTLREWILKQRHLNARLGKTRIYCRLSTTSQINSL